VNAEVSYAACIKMENLYVGKRTGDEEVGKLLSIN
jgi:hypothetical protein